VVGVTSQHSITSLVLKWIVTFDLTLDWIKVR